MGFIWKKKFKLSSSCPIKSCKMRQENRKLQIWTFSFCSCFLVLIQFDFGRGRNTSCHLFKAYLGFWYGGGSCCQLCQSVSRLDGCLQKPQGFPCVTGMAGVQAFIWLGREGEELSVDNPYWSHAGLFAVLKYRNRVVCVAWVWRLLNFILGQP